MLRWELVPFIEASDDLLGDPAEAGTDALLEIGALN